jgi:hypothetical protein
MDLGAIERLGARIRDSRAQEPSVAREAADQHIELQAEIRAEIDQGLGRELN